VCGREESERVLCPFESFGLNDWVGKKREREKRNMAAKKRAKKAKRKSPKKTAKKSKKKAHGEIVASHAVSRQKGFLYFVDGAGNVRKSKMKKGGTRGHRTCK
jgi:hypothetical protein